MSSHDKTLLALWITDSGADFEVSVRAAFEGMSASEIGRVFGMLVGNAEHLRDGVARALVADGGDADAFRAGYAAGRLPALAGGEGRTVIRTAPYTPPEEEPQP